MAARRGRRRGHHSGRDLGRDLGSDLFRPTEDKRPLTYRERGDWKSGKGDGRVTTTDDGLGANE